jgi:hypothetical protein
MKKPLREVVNFLFVIGLLLEWPVVLFCAWLEDRREQKFRL